MTDTPKFPPLMAPEDALALMLGRVQPLSGSETVALNDALGRVLAEPVISGVTSPPWDNSAMDGYAVNTTDLKGDTPRLRVSQRIPAGVSGEPLQSGTVARIFTGAPIPANADAVVVQEVCEADGDQVIIRKLPKAGENIRRAGEDTVEGQQVVDPGTRLGPQHLGLAASVGCASVSVKPRPKVAVFSSGDELVMPGEALGPGKIYNSNQFTLTALLQGLGCEVLNLGIIEDTFDATCEALARGAAQADLVMTSGGVSVGEEDHVKPALEKLGSLDMWKLAIRPGKPLAFGHIGETPFIGTPGNPVSLFVTFCLFARPFILSMQGVREGLNPVALRVQADFDWPKPDGKRREYARARLRLGTDGRPEVAVFRSRSSGVLTSLAWANGLVVIHPGQTVKPGDEVDFLPYGDLLT